MTILRSPGVTSLAVLVVAAPSLWAADAASGYATDYAGESNLRQSHEAVTLWTDSGLMMALRRSDGALQELLIGKVRVCAGAGTMVRFEEVAEDPDAPDLLGDGAFADGPGGWAAPAGAVEPGPPEIGGHWLRLEGARGESATRDLILDQTEAQPIIASARCRAVTTAAASGWMNQFLALNVYGTYTDGETMPEQSAYFGQYNHGPQPNRKVLCPDRPLRSVRLLLTVPGGPTTAWYSDVTVRRARYLRGTAAGACEQIDHRAVQQFWLPDLALHGTVSWEPLARAIVIRCRFASTKSDDRAISAYVSLPLDAVGGRWWDDLRTSRPIQAGKLYRHAQWYGAGRDGWVGRYPIACLSTADGTTLGIGTSPEEPRVFMAEYDAAARELRLRYDLGLVADAGPWSGRGAFTALLFPCEAQDGFRGATETYHRLYEWAFLTKRATREGLWEAFGSPKSIAGGPDGFHLQIVEATGNAGWENRQGMYSFRYVEPWICHHESPPHAPFAEAAGPVDPAAALERATEMAARNDPRTPPDLPGRYAAYLASYIEDNWGQPQGYFFRNPGGRNENMMIVNPNLRLPAGKVGLLNYGQHDWESALESLSIWKQWSLPGWSLARCGDRPTLEIDRQIKAEGRQSVRFDPVRSKNYYEQYLRGMAQSLFLPAKAHGPLTFSCRARATDVPAQGTGLGWTIELQSADDRVEVHRLGLAGLTDQWQTYRLQITPGLRPLAVTVSLGNLPWFPDPTVLWIDDVRLTAQGRSGNLLTNGGLEHAELLPVRLTGMYLDTMECYTNNLNYRREHWPYTDDPLTFDCGRRPALQQQFSHIQYARELADRLHRRGMLLFANCAPGTPFAAPYLDIMGGEEDWMPGGQWTPKSDEACGYVRFMCRAKPFGLLQYADLDAEHTDKYIQRCLFYGIWPSNQSSSRTSGKWYWTNAARMYRDRPIYRRYMPALTTITRAGWEPITLARSTNPAVWVERYGAGDTMYWTLLNPTSERQTTRLVFDQRARVGIRWTARELLSDRPLRVASEGTTAALTVTLQPEQVRVVRLTRR